VFWATVAAKVATIVEKEIEPTSAELSAAMMPKLKAQMTVEAADGVRHRASQPSRLLLFG